MAIPDFQSVMLPLVQYMSDGQEHSLREAIESLSNYFKLTAEERRELLPSGRQSTFDNRVSWATTHLKSAGLLESPRRSYYKITSRGLEVLQQNPTQINTKFLERYPEYVEFRNKKSPDAKVPSVSISELDEQTPKEAMGIAYQRIRSALATEILQQIMNCSPAFFERMVVELLVKMGYGGSLRDAGEAVGRSGDGGIDGIIKEDRLGLDVIYIQAKRWEGTVGRPEIQKFVGALQGQRSKKGIFITTSSFAPNAYQYVDMIENKVVLVDGETLAELMIDNNVGVSSDTTYEIKRVDSDYFVEG
jgi:restriction system protein